MVLVAQRWILARLRHRTFFDLGELNEAIWWAFKEEGIVIAFPQLDVHLDPAALESIRRRDSSD